MTTATRDLPPALLALLGKNRPATPADTPQTDSREYSSPAQDENPAEGQETPHSATRAETGAEIPAPALSLQEEQAAAAAIRAHRAKIRDLEQRIAAA